MDSVLHALKGEGVAFYLESYSALDRYFGVKEPGPVHVRTDDTLVTLARLFDELSFPGEAFVDARVIEDGKVYHFRCVDDMDRSSGFPFTALDLLYDNGRDSFKDPSGIYQDLRRDDLVLTTVAAGGWEPVMEAARLVSRYHYQVDPADLPPLPAAAEPSLDEQRGLLSAILTAPFPHKGMAVLHAAGFLRRLWPELQEMDQTQQSKEHHPEGDVWNHTLQALSGRKGRGLRLGLAVLLHDVGKPASRADGTRERPFHNHSHFGARLAGRFLRRVGYDQVLIQDVEYLVRHHMMPAALSQLPLYRTERLMASSLFPDLLELYRADLVSTFRKPTRYYEACRIYKKFLKGNNNPYAVRQRSRPPV